MITQVYAIYDNKASSFSFPIFAPNEAVARRIFNDCINSPKSTYNMHPADFSLVSLGTYDDETGKVDNLPNAITICHGFEVIKNDERQLDIEKDLLKTRHDQAPRIVGGTK